ncbi:unnamed protein product [Tuber melanosporum]|jgi:acyl-CoA-binding protein|uniref:(Perigord truffle) hypothetical protein n=1 Tax=Tuber melanosporum (strain Mel28) TaxID=656061 RepID=D5GMN1_TUBMM|nr:uncharacterized protein GSTUM_00010822001 [Tuber melanosporum]CAZ85774.1 unnamed protein product [Tuber melanosporum]
MTSRYNPTSAFYTAAESVGNLAGYDDPGVKLLAYSLYKQTRVGDVTGSRPLLDPESKMKFDAWTLVKGMTHQEADARYLNCSEHMVQGVPLNPENSALLGAIKEKLGVNKPYLSSLWR